VLWSPLAGGSDPSPTGREQPTSTGRADIYKEAGRAPPWQKFESLFTFVQASTGRSRAGVGMFGVDDATFVQQMCTFLKHHATETEEFYESKPGSIFDLGNKPASRAVYRRCITHLAGLLPAWAV